VFFDHPVHLEREQRLRREIRGGDERKKPDRVGGGGLVQATDGGGTVERSFRRLKDVLAVRPLYHRVEPRVRGHIFVAALALLLQMLLQRRLDEAAVGLSAEQAMQAMETIRHVTFQVQEETRSGVSAKNPRARQVLNALKITDL